MNVNLDYIAGFFDGEGSGHMLVIQRRTILGFTLRPRFTITQKNKEVLEVIRDYLGFGKVRQAPSHRNHVWTLYINDMPNCRAFAEMMIPRCFVKKPQTEIILKAIKLKMQYGGQGRTIPAKAALEIIDVIDELWEANSHTRSYIRRKNTTAKLREQILNTDYEATIKRRMEAMYKARTEALKLRREKRSGANSHIQ